MSGRIGLSVNAALGGLFECTEGLFRDLEEPDPGVLQEVIDKVARRLAADKASLMLLDTSEQALVLRGSIGLPPSAAEYTRVPLGESISAWVAKHQEPQFSWQTEDLPLPVVQAMDDLVVSSALSVPVVVSGRVLGVLNLARCGSAEQFNHTHLQFADLACRKVGAFLHMSELNVLLKERERSIARLLENIPSSVLLVDRQLRVVYANRMFMGRTHRSEATTVGHRLVDVLPKSLVGQAQVAKRIEEVFRTGNAVEGGKVSFRAPSVPTHIYFVRFAPVSTGLGEYPSNVMLLMDDVTEQERLGAEVKRMEVHLAGVVECANDLVASLDRQGRIVSWNPAAERASGLALDQVQGRSMVDLCSPEDRGTMSDILGRLAQEHRVQDVEVTLLGAGGAEVPISWSSSIMRDDGGGVAGMVVVGRDLTERRHLEERLIQSDKMGSLGVMAGGIAHELRNPLAVIAVSAQLLLEKWADQALRDTCLEKINGSTMRASLIIENLLKFARPQEEKMVLIDVGELLEDTFMLLSDQLVIQQVMVCLKPVGSGVKVRGNPDLLQQVFTNIVLNACNAMPEGGSLAANATSGGDDKVRIAFRDTGRGIPLENLPNLFDPFFTTSPAGSKFVGLGLSIAYSIVRQHHGSIEVESEPGRGSIFTVVLPRV